MSEIEISNGRIERTMLGVEDHVVFTCSLTVKFGACVCGFGGYRLDCPPDGEGTARGMNFIIRIMRAVGVGNWEDLKGKYVRIKHDHNGIHAIGHIVEDKWFSPDDLKEQL